MPALPEQAWRDFFANSACLEADSEKIHARYLNKWIGIYRGQIVAVEDSFDGVVDMLTSQNIPTGDALIRFVGQKDITLIL